MSFQSLLTSLNVIWNKARDSLLGLRNQDAPERTSLMDPQTPLSRIFGTPFDLPLQSSTFPLSMNDHTLPAGDSLGLAIRERKDRRDHWKHVKDYRSHVEDASEVLQNALGVRNTKIWPTPPLADTVSNCSMVERNGANLRNALSACKQYAVKMDRSSEFRDFLDHTVGCLEERKAKTNKRVETEKSASLDNEEASSIKEKDTRSNPLSGIPSAKAHSSASRNHSKRAG